MTDAPAEPTDIAARLEAEARTWEFPGQPAPVALLMREAAAALRASSAAEAGPRAEVERLRIAIEDSETFFADGRAILSKSHPAIGVDRVAALEGKVAEWEAWWSRAYDGAKSIGGSRIPDQIYAYELSAKRFVEDRPARATLTKEPETDANRYWFDTEFIEDGRTIKLLSIGIVSEDGREYYAEPLGADLGHASEWVRENVLPHLEPVAKSKPSRQIASEIVAFVGENPEFWAYYADYDWVALCQLFGTMMDLPKGWPRYCRDLKQLADERGITLPQQTGTEHHALADARWTREAWQVANAQ